MNTTAIAPPISPASGTRPKRKAQGRYLVRYPSHHPSFINDNYVFAETMSAYHKRRPGHQWRGFGRYGNCSEMLPFLQAMQELVEHQGWTVEEIESQLAFEGQGHPTPDLIGLHLFVTLFRKAPGGWIALG